MAEISYFQRYSKKENTATNNTLLLLKLFYQTDQSKFTKAINILCDEELLNVGVNFRQQTRQGNSIPDGRIYQSAFEVLIETKKGHTLDTKQIKRHLYGHTGTISQGTTRVLFGLTTTILSEDDQVEYMRMAHKRNTIFKAITFYDILSALRQTLDFYDTQLIAVLDDYEAYLQHDKLLPEGDILYVIPCGISMRENLTHKIYFEPSSRWSKRRGKYIGLYTNKEVQYIGQPKSIINGILIDGEFDITSKEKTSKYDNCIDTIQAVIKACSYFPNFATEEHRYYIFDDFHKTSFKKSSFGGIWGARKFYVNEITGKKHSDAKSLSTALNGKTFE